jgi:hypothetical protein
MLTIEFEPPESLACECCGHATTKLVRFVRNEDGAYAVYLAQFAQAHPQRDVIGIISLGSWGGEDARPADRVAFGFHMWEEDGQLQTRIVDVAETPWHSADFFGVPLRRAEALMHPLLPEVFHLSDHIAADDQPIRAYLRGSSHT